MPQWHIDFAIGNKRSQATCYVSSDGPKLKPQQA